MTTTADPKPQVGESYIMLSTAANPFEKRYAKVLAIEKGYVQFKGGAQPDYMRGKPRSCTLKKFMDTYGPL